MADNILNLPRLAKGAPFKAASDSGAWKSADGTLQSLGRSLPLPDPAFDDPDEPIRAIPDPWAQPRAFGEALLDEKHSMHSRALPQWRGLLALFALKELHAGDYGIKPKQVLLSGDHIMEKVLTHLLPMVAMGKLADSKGKIDSAERQTRDLWGSPWLFELSGPGVAAPRILVMSNPICLVSPGRQSLAGLTIQGVNWVQGAVLDPLSAGVTLPVTELAALKGWLEQVRADLEPLATNETGAKIRDLLRLFAADCQTKLGQAKVVAEVSSSTNTKLPELYRPLWRSATPSLSGDPWDSAQTQLRLNPQFDLGKIAGVMLVDSAIGALPGHDPATTFVWGTRTLAELLASESLFTEVRGEARQAGWWLIRADDLFTDRAVGLGGKGKARASAPGNPEGLKDVVLPLRPLALMLLGGRKAINGRLQGDQLTVNLALTLGGPGGAETAFTLNQSYATSPGPQEKLLVANAEWDISNVSLWPDFASDAWKTYLARIYYPEDRQGTALLPRTAFSSALISGEVQRRSTGDEAITDFDALNRGRALTADDIDFRRSTKPFDRNFEEMQFSTKPFDGLLYVEQASSRSEAQVGIILHAPKEPEKQVSEKESVVAIDFGTTNTVACLNDRNPVVFKRRIAFPILTNSSDLNHSSLSSDGAQRALKRFMPYNEHSTPTPTVAYTRVGHPESRSLKYFGFRNFIYFYGDPDVAKNGEKLAMDRLRSDSQQFRFGLKWREDSAHAEAASDFLEQFMTLVAAEALNEGYDPGLIRWRFSIPDSLQGRQRSNFRGYLDAITRGISYKIRDDSESGPALSDLKSEGLAASSHMLLDAGFIKGSLNIVLDIGGGTTDVTLWQRTNLIWQGSLRLAGINFFTRYIASNPVILGEIGLSQWEILLLNLPAGSDAIDADAQERDYLTELLFSSPLLKRAINDHWDRRLAVEAGESLRLVSLVMLGGIAWYLGHVARKLLSDCKIEPADFQKVAVALCGRGAGLFKKIHGIRAESETDVSAVLRLFSVAAGVDVGTIPQVFSSKDEKMEVVRGMIDEKLLVSQSAATGKAAALNFQPAALEVEFSDGNRLREGDMVGPGMLAHPVKEIGMAEFDAFVAALKTFGGIKLDLFKNSGQGARNKIIDAVHDKLESERLESERLDKDAGHAPEPPFISALRALVAIMAAPEEVRRERLKADFV